MVEWRTWRRNESEIRLGKEGETDKIDGRAVESDWQKMEAKAAA